MRPAFIRGRRFAARIPSLAEEQGIALIMALGILLVLTIALTTIAFLTTNGTQDAQRVNAGQKAAALAEAGVNNAIAVLNKSYPQATFPGPTNLLPTTTTTYSSGKVTWSGSLVLAAVGAGWPYQWNITAVGDVPNPTGPGTADVTRTLTAIIPVTTPTSWNNGNGQSAINYIYALHDISFQQSLVVEAPVFAGGNLSLSDTAVISENVPPSATNPNPSKNTVAVGGTLTMTQNANQIGEWIGDGTGLTTYNHESSAGQLGNPGPPVTGVWIAGGCSTKNNGTLHTPCQEGDGLGNHSTRDPIYALNQSGGSISTTFPPSNAPPTPNMNCCSPVTNGGSVATNNTPAGSCTPGPGCSTYMGFWYQTADLGPRDPCDPSQSTGSYPTFDNDGIMNASSPTWNLTGATYNCVSRSGFGRISWDGSKLFIKGTIFYDGNVCVGSGGCGTNLNATYTGQGSIIMTGTFSMVNGDNMCVPPAAGGGTCDPSVAWDPNNSSLGIIAYGNDGSGNSIAIKKGQIQGLMMGYNNVYCQPASGTLVQGPMVSVDGSIICGQSSTLAFPAISFPSTGFAGSTGPLPPAVLGPPVQYGGG